MKSTTLDLLLTMSKPTALSNMSCSAILHITVVTGSPLFIVALKRLNLINLKQEQEMNNFFFQSLLLKLDSSEYENSKRESKNAPVIIILLSMIELENRALNQPSILIIFQDSKMKSNQYDKNYRKLKYIYIYILR